MKEHKPYMLQFDVTTALQQEIKTLKETQKTQQEAVNAATKVIDELRKENQLLKANLYLRELNNELAKYKKLLEQANSNYENLVARHELLMSKYIRQ